ncbi:hypothetical protein L2E82_06591 [Cichorium intybus]|uniref:Uncharacterized protein n=1 Tax=Cichorium intybus TaxID=13427 RepID=A0ACB9HB78_CICIN|nr:hypothetical protein L2E82_06591 [Cichorium intybus]
MPMILNRQPFKINNNPQSLSRSFGRFNRPLLIHRIPRSRLLCKVQEDDKNAFDALPHVRHLNELQKDDLFGKVVMVRFDSNILLGEKQNQQSKTFITALSTIKYLHESGAKVILISSWSIKTNSNLHSLDYISAYMSSILKLKVLPMKLSPVYELTTEDSQKPSIYLLENLSQFKDDIANNSRFSQELSSGVDIFVNDAFFQSHKTLASTVGVTSFCYASLAGFHFEKGLLQLKKAFGSKRKPFIAMVGGGNLVEKAAAINYLVSNSDGLIFVGNISFQIIHALGFSVPKKYLEVGALKEANKIIQFANSRNIPILFPKDFWCMNDQFKKPKLIPSHCIPEGWMPFSLGPNSLEEMTTLLSNSKKIVWIGPIKFGFSNQDSYTTSILANLLGKLSQENCDVTFIGNMASKALMEESMVFNSSFCNIIENASVVWEFLKGRKLPGLMALDRGYPYCIDWHTIYADPNRPLFVDIGSGNGMFLFGMARKRKDMNFLGLEMNGKLVKRCLETCHLSGLKNGYFIETNATSTFRSIVSSYPGKLVFASIQCPNPDFNKPENRWKMVQRSLIEAILELLSYNGKVFLQSDIEGVALRMKEEFLKYGNGKFLIDHQQEWLAENPFGVESDWEKHVLDNGVPMYRLMLSKS